MRRPRKRTLKALKGTIQEYLEKHDIRSLDPLIRPYVQLTGYG